MRPWTETARRSWCGAQPRLGDEGRRFATAPPDAAWVLRFSGMCEGEMSRAGLPAALAEIADEGFVDLVVRAKTALRDGLLAWGGWAVNQPGLDDDLDRVIARGVLLDGAAARLVRGEPGQCHRNSAWLWSRRPGNRAIMTGYALSPDGMWREHSWVVEAIASGEPRLVETTVRRTAYFGFLRNEAESLRLLGGDHERPSPRARLEDMRARLQEAIGPREVADLALPSAPAP